ncbi:acetyl/propionyl-CoA carboxylase subuit alpha [Marmoricola sp. Leaf446]|uniref:acetyl/propionyl/methylcrotonyl-CoA carboxylase subunit alpha n=1 Tax=Marmoricola sp. Leaf446 TaxID=1736379 RepID=UPI000700411E|nr:biotin carboxylase N-terminal domain-containing protein [Marmoricola sp. Leaf446]KQT90693.1 acetyl/propionyl-CoA carboxylase subuit alpha [Marmoricola sp. Leaf446]
MTITRLLVANRGEIARRVFATCRRLGIETVAIHSDADAGLPFVREADLAVRLPGDAPADTYLRADLVLDAARRTGADAIHPGYGFLSENAGFARAVLDAGLTWIGPAPASIEAMGSKIEAKKLMKAAGVPVLRDLDPAAVTEADLPVLVKASAGGGGRGMRVVRLLDALPDAVTSARAEAESAFGDGTVFVESYLEHGRHVEVQVVGDGRGEVLVLGERDCSVQRRHQKVVEESPAPGLSDDVRRTLHDAARDAAAAIDYVGAGTVEFMVAGEKVAFLEMNTRLQVEHPVTEAVFGVDLVELQLQVAEGESCVPPGAGAPSQPHDPIGHAIEVRLYAEDPSADYQPQSGRLGRFEVPDVDVAFGPLAGPGIRLDSGFESGNEVGTHYDAMLAKVIAWAPTREQAARRLAGALRRARLHGVRTNRELLVEVLGHEAFLAGDLSTDFLHDHAFASIEDDALPGTATDQGLLCFAAAVALTERDVARRPVQRGIPSGWRNVVSAPQVTPLEVRGTRVDVGWLGGRGGYRFVDTYGEVHGARAVSVTGGPERWQVVVEHGGVSHPVEVTLHGDLVPHAVDVDAAAGHLALVALPRFVDPADVLAEGSLLAPMPGTVVGVPVAEGAQVAAGDPVVVLEAMKMQHTIKAPVDGVVTDLVAAGQQVAAGDVLAVVSTSSTSDDGTTHHDEGEPA